MKKLALLFLTVALGLLPFQTKAVYEVDENGNPVPYEGKAGEYHILLTEEENKSSEDVTSSDETTRGEPDKSVDNSNTDNLVIAPNPNGEDIYTILAEDSKSESTATENNNMVFYTVGSGVLGFSLGAALVYFLTKKH